MGSSVVVSGASVGAGASVVAGSCVWMQTFSYRRNEFYTPVRTVVGTASSVADVDFVRIVIPIAVVVASPAGDGPTGSGGELQP